MSGRLESLFFFSVNVEFMRDGSGQTTVVSRWRVEVVSVEFHKFVACLLSHLSDIDRWCSHVISSHLISRRSSHQNTAHQKSNENVQDIFKIRATIYTKTPLS